MDSDVTSAAALMVDVVSDVVCPWCFIGKRKLERALAQFKAAHPSADVQVRWHPFELNPDLPAEGIPRSTYLARKFGGEARAGDIYARVEQAGEAVGIAFAFDRIATQPNTRDGHRLVAWAQQQGDADAVVERLFSAFFLEGRHVGDPAELARVAAQSGLSEDAARAMLASDALRDVVSAESREAIDAGIHGVPCFIFNGRVAVSGAQDPEAILQAIGAAQRDA
jgi:predicted DsbA family dithiol-disulfide isomerase